MATAGNEVGTLGASAGARETPCRALCTGSPGTGTVWWLITPCQRHRPAATRYCAHSACATAPNVAARPLCPCHGFEKRQCLPRTAPPPLHGPAETALRDAASAPGPRHGAHGVDLPCLRQNGALPEIRLPGFPTSASMYGRRGMGMLLSKRVHAGLVRRLHVVRPAVEQLCALRRHPVSGTDAR